ncbi:oligosaccharide repeat unit polymerase [Clostridium collagenovorans DSM 3089]|uniref:Oligosaccharide repeat unit polymerase n=1 Tax=Clostridium collagenovorans DSM 3089 TaxID=1121306 RepID=A0A1M5X3S8_9CLOT|nr:O-antigen polymerase [Clostridium collagenovorans]SHH94252.1 oligosaccharide repeat unit polymerase [Clostridium collagenovorans DSM 3089]
MIYIYIFFNILLFVFSRKIFKKNINPVSIYCIVWSIISILYELKFIYYYKLSIKTWSIIFLMQGLFSIGNFMGVLIYNIKVHKKNNTLLDENIIKNKIFKVIMISSLISAISIIPNIVSLIKVYGINGLFSSIGDIYNNRVNGTGENIYISYFGPFIFIALMYTGVYIRKYGVRKFLFLPIILAILNSLSFGGRNNIIMGFLFLTIPMFIGEREYTKQLKLNNKNKIYIIIFIIVFILLFSIINKERANITSISPYVSPLMNKLTSTNHSIYKLYTYATSPIGVLNEYLNNPFYSFGANTFLPIYKQFSKLGFNVELMWTLPFYHIPISSNVGTYIMELIIDFSIPGACAVSYFLGIVSGNIFTKLMDKKDILSYVIVTIVTFCTIMSFFIWYMRSINMWIILFFSIFFGKFIVYQRK